MTNFKSISNKTNFKYYKSFDICLFRICLLICLLGYLLICLLPKDIYAVMKSEDYQLQSPNLNFSSGNISSQNILGTKTNSYASTGYRLSAGFGYVKSTIPFSFSVSNQVIKFDTLASGTPQTATALLTISAGGTGGYQVTAYENHPPKSDSLDATIPDTTGDKGNITEGIEGPWSLETTFGFGYTMSSLYKQFADFSKGEPPEAIMVSSAIEKNQTATITYKINVSAVQPAGKYHNVITYVATPTF